MKASLLICLICTVHCAVTTIAQKAKVTALKTNIADDIEDITNMPEKYNTTSPTGSAENITKAGANMDAQNLQQFFEDPTGGETTLLPILTRRSGGSGNPYITSYLPLPSHRVLPKHPPGPNHGLQPPQRQYSTLDGKGHMHVHTFSEEHVHIDDNYNVLDANKMRVRPSKGAQKQKIKLVAPSSSHGRKPAVVQGKRRSKPRVNGQPHGAMKPPPAKNSANKGPDYNQEIFHDYDDIVSTLPKKLHKNPPRVEDLNQAFKRQKNFKDMDSLLGTMGNAKYESGSQTSNKPGKHNSQYQSSSFDRDFANVKQTSSKGTSKNTSTRPSGRSIIPTPRPPMNKTLSDYIIHIDKPHTTTEKPHLYYDIKDLPEETTLIELPESHYHFLDKPIDLPYDFNLRSAVIPDVDYRQSSKHKTKQEQQQNKHRHIEFTTSYPIHGNKYNKGNRNNEGHIQSYDFGHLQTDETQGVVTVVQNTKKIRIRGRPRTAPNQQQPGDNAGKNVQNSGGQQSSGQPARHEEPVKHDSRPGGSGGQQRPHSGQTRSENVQQNRQMQQQRQQEQRQQEQRQQEHRQTSTRGRGSVKYGDASRFDKRVSN